MILLCSVVGNVFSCEKEKLDPCRKFGKADGYVSGLGFKSKKDYLTIFSSIAKDPSVDIESHRSTICSMTECFDLPKALATRKGCLRVATEEVRPGLISLLINSYEGLLRSYNGMEALECLIDNEDKYSDDRLREVSYLFYRGGARLYYNQRMGIDYPKLVKSTYLVQEKKRRVINLLTQYETAEKEENRLKREKQEKKLQRFVIRRAKL